VTALTLFMNENVQANKPKNKHVKVWRIRVDCMQTIVSTWS